MANEKIEPCEELDFVQPHKKVPVNLEVCGDAISRQWLIERAISWDKHFADSERYVSLTDIQNAPPVNPQQKYEDIVKALQPKTGHWVIRPNDMYPHLICDNCLASAPYNCRTKYCPICGRRMVEPQEKR